MGTGGSKQNVRELRKQKVTCIERLLPKSIHVNSPSRRSLQGHPHECTEARGVGRSHLVRTKNIKIKRQIASPGLWREVEQPGKQALFLHLQVRMGQQALGLIQKSGKSFNMIVQDIDIGGGTTGREGRGAQSPFVSLREPVKGIRRLTQVEAKVFGTSLNRETAQSGMFSSNHFLMLT